jgi:hypothetical protein
MDRLMHPFQIVTSILLFVFCSTGLPVAEKHNVVKLEVSPSSTDLKIRDKGTKHSIYVDNNVRKLNKLFVFFPGTGAPPRLYTKILYTAAEQGYHAIGLVYENEESVNYDICTPQNVKADPDCHKRVRLEILDGKDRSSFVNVDRANSIENRLIKLLEYLHQNQSQQKWNQFISNGKLRWDFLVLSGHSQGGGHAAIAGMIHKCNRIVLFSSPEPAAWTTEVSKTPPHLYFGLVHQKEDIYRAVVFAWQRLRIPGAPVSADNQISTLQSHQIVTSVNPVGPKRRGLPNYHGSVVANPFTPLDQTGTPILSDVWIYLLTSDPNN